MCGILAMDYPSCVDDSRQRQKRFIERMKNAIKGTSLSKVIRLIDKQHEIEAVDLLGPRQYFTDENGNQFKYRISFKDLEFDMHPANDWDIERPTHEFFFNLPNHIQIF